jgi:hypothetical protein
MDPAALDTAIREDRGAGLLPAAVVACIGGTSIGACDDVAAVAEVARRHGLYLHVDAAWAGSAMICPEFRHLMSGADEADSFVFNPHKWLFTNFDCSAHFVKDPSALTDTLGIRPPFLRTLGKEVFVDYSEWSLPLGRRFRALKLWFVIRSYGVEALQDMIRRHVAWAEELAALVDADSEFELVTGPVLSLFSFRYAPAGAKDLDALNQALVERINDDGRIYVTQTRHDDRFVIRFQVGQTSTMRADVMVASSRPLCLAPLRVRRERCRSAAMGSSRRRTKRDEYSERKRTQQLAPRPDLRPRCLSRQFKPLRIRRHCGRPPSATAARTAPSRAEATAARIGSRLLRARADSSRSMCRPQLLCEDAITTPYLLPRTVSVGRVWASRA